MGDRMKLRLPIRPDEDAVLFVTVPMTSGDWSQMMGVLEAMKPGIVKDETQEEVTDG